MSTPTEDWSQRDAETDLLARAQAECARCGHQPSPSLAQLLSDRELARLRYFEADAAVAERIAALPPLAPESALIPRMKIETRRECQLVAKRAMEGLTFDEATELLRLQRAAQLASDKLAEKSTEGRVFPAGRENIHE